MMLDQYTNEELRTIMMKIWRKTYQHFGGVFDAITFKLSKPHTHRVYMMIGHELKIREQ